MKNVQVIAASCGVMMAGGCGSPSDRLVFLSRSSVGVDLDTAPPTASIGIDRSEAVIAPIFENGETPPVIAGFRYADEGMLAGHAGSAFASGDAAAAMSMLYDGQTPVRKDDAAFDSSIMLANRPETAAESSEPGRVRSLVFGTTSTIGLKASWSGAYAPLPDAFHFGLHRKEFAWAPVMSRESVDDTGRVSHSVKAPSLLATVDVGAEGGSIVGGHLESVQYFATGAAATSLAQEQQVRRAMLVRLDPNSPRLASARLYQQTTAAREQLATWLDESEEDPSRRAMLQAWLHARGIDESVTTWIHGADEADLMRAIQELIESDAE